MIPQGEGCRKDVVAGGGWQHTGQTLEKSPTSKLDTTWAHILSDRNVFASRGEGVKRRGPMPLGLFLFFSPPSGRGVVIRVFFSFGGYLPKTSARSKRYLPVILVRLALFRQNFQESWCRKITGDLMA